MKEIEIAEVRQLTEVVKSTYNYDFGDYALSSFKRRLSRVLEVHSHETIASLTAKVKSDPVHFKEFLAEITVNVTEMFRDPSFWRLLRDDVIPELLKVSSNLKIWHAGCSSGEEVYSMSILLKEMGILESTKIFASDIDHEILANAQTRFIKQKSQETNRKNYESYNNGVGGIDQYFTEKDGGYELDASLLKNVSFKEHNLVSDAAFSKFDLILCRNVLIYFNQTLQNKVLKTFNQSLFKGSLLAIGSKESLIWCEDINKFSVFNNEEKVYKKIAE